MNSSETPPSELADQASALAAHLQRQGVQFLPAADEATVAQLQAGFGTVSQQSAAPDATGDSTPAAPVAPIQSASQTEAAQSPVPAPPGPASSGPVSSGPPPAPATRMATVSLIDNDEGSYPGEPLPLADRQLQLDGLAQQVAGCTACPALVGCRTNTVFGEGSPAPRVAFFGEGPGADEDRTGRPFVGKAGQLLTKMIEACTFRREDVYILNTVKCRPPGNRNPEPEEISNCRAYFETQLSILRPEYIVCLGAVSSQALLKSKLSVGRMRGKLHRYFDSKVLVTYHPAYLLRNPAAKKAAWQDLQLMLKDAGIDPKQR